MHTFGFIELPTNDVQASCKFYRELFGWNTGMSKDTDYGYFWPQTGVKGGFSPNDTPASNGVVVYIETHDIEEVLNKAMDLGGEVVRRKTEIGGGHGFTARFKDNMGNVLGLWSKG